MYAHRSRLEQRIQFRNWNGFATLAAVFLICIPGFAEDTDQDVLVDKTLVVWVAPENLEQSGGSALTINDTTADHFDGIVFAELAPKVWMPGSNGFSRTNQQQAGWSQETAAPDEFVHIAIVYRGQQIAMYRNGKLHAEYVTSGQPYRFGPNTAVLFGQRHLKEGVDHFKGRIRDARIYNVALDGQTISKMKPAELQDDIQPWAWWDFASTGTYDRMGRFNQVKLSDGVRIEDGCLVLEGSRPTMLATIDRDSGNVAIIPDANWSENDPVPASVVQSTRVLREKFLNDAYRPGYHFCVPEDQGMPGDPNGCFYSNGRYHLMYLYNRNGTGFSWGHISSSDLVHWSHHPDAIGPGEGDEGCFSGGGFVDEDGTAYLSYWMLWGAKGIGLARSNDRHFDYWKKLAANPVIESTEFGITETTSGDGNKLVYGSADPSNIWKKDGKYYMLTGNLLVLNKYGRSAEAPEDMKGDRLYLFESSDLQQWSYQGVFYDRNSEWTESSEDNMCPSFLPLPSSPKGGEPSDKHLLLFISHNKGCQYYVGEYDVENDRFIPENHGRMSWVDNTYFAPEALVDKSGRQIMWAWLRDNPAGESAKGWSGVYGLPRSLWLGEDGTLRMRPVRELEALRCNEKTWKDIELNQSQDMPLDGIVGDSCELEIVLDPRAAERVGVKVRASAGDEESTLLYYDASTQQLCFDSRRSGADGRKTIERAPLKLKDGEPLQLRVFVDKSVIEVYANDRQAICRRVYPTRSDSLGVELFAEGGEANCTRVNAWEMMPSNPY
ncbi:GH32 C-terminal domain-containing protein [Bremerella sp. JC770]|uniref:GH32 C-terminal domain-containing protein n=1 Tax=Bremerella sp. JC770 TaxID=3232137 RepID=UPI00345B00CE